jgi:hypothetical protein
VHKKSIYKIKIFCLIEESLTRKQVRVTSLAFGLPVSCTNHAFVSKKSKRKIFSCFPFTDQVLSHMNMWIADWRKMARPQLLLRLSNDCDGTLLARFLLILVWLRSLSCFSVIPRSGCCYSTSAYFRDFRMWNVL